MKMLKCFIFLLIPFIVSAILLSNSKFSILIFPLVIFISIWVCALIINHRKYTKEKIKADGTDFLILFWIALIGILTYFEIRYDLGPISRLFLLDLFTLLSFLIGIVFFILIFQFFDQNVAHFVCSERFIEKCKALEEKIGKINKTSMKTLEMIFESSKTWLDNNENLLSSIEKKLFKRRADNYKKWKNGIKCRADKFIKAISFSQGIILSYRYVIDLQDQYNDLVKDMEKIEGEIETDLKGLIARYPKSSGLPELKRQHPKLFSSKRKS